MRTWPCPSHVKRGSPLVWLLAIALPASGCTAEYVEDAPSNVAEAPPYGEPEPPPAVTPPNDEPNAAPSPPPAEPPPPPVSGAPSPAPAGSAPVYTPTQPSGQWVYTSAEGWVWMPYSREYTYVTPAQDDAYAYVYYPAGGWAWIHAPWVIGIGPRPYWGRWGPVRFAWYTHPWFHPRRVYYYRRPYYGPRRVYRRR